MESQFPQSRFDKDLILAKSGCQEALGRILSFFRFMMLAYVRDHLPAELQVKEAPSDLVQDSFLEASQDFSQFNGNTKEELWAWLRAILQHNLGNLYRDYRDCQKRRISREVSLDDPRHRHVKEGLVDRMPTPSEQTSAKEEMGRAEKALMHLTEDRRTAVIMRARQRASFQEIGQVLNCSAEAARKIYARAIHRLAMYLEAE